MEINAQVENPATANRMPNRTTRYIFGVEPRGVEPLTSAVQSQIHNVVVVHHCPEIPGKLRFCFWEHSWVFAVVCMGWCTTGVREVRAVGHVLLLPGLSIAGQENAGSAVAQEDGYRVVVGLARALARRRCEGVGLTAARTSCPCIFIHPTTCRLWRPDPESLGSLPRTSRRRSMLGSGC
jgi:hypothetical protein